MQSPCSLLSSLPHIPSIVKVSRSLSCNKRMFCALSQCGTTLVLLVTAVSNITGRADVLGGLFFIVSFLVYATACEQDSLLWSAVVTILSQVMVAMATLSKETGKSLQLFSRRKHRVVCYSYTEQQLTGIVAVGVHILYEILYCTPLLSVLWMNRPSGDRETRRTASWWSCKYLCFTIFIIQLSL